MMKLPAKSVYTVGIISDTHGHLPSGAVKAFENADLIIHAGDIGQRILLSVLRKTAPVVAVLGNMDRPGRGGVGGLPQSEVVEVGEVRIYVLHDLLKLDLDPAAAGFKVVISGHTHTPFVGWRDDVLFVDPGSATHPRAKKPPTVALLHVRGKSLDAAVVELYE